MSHLSGGWLLSTYIAQMVPTNKAANQNICISEGGGVKIK